MEKGIQNAIILEADEALLLTAQEEFDDILPDGKYTLSGRHFNRPFDSQVNIHLLSYCYIN